MMIGLKGEITKYPGFIGYHCKNCKYTEHYHTTYDMTPLDESNMRCIICREKMELVYDER